MRKFNFFLGGVILTLLLTLHGVFAQNGTQHNKGNEGIQFFVGSWPQVLEMAELMKKPIFVYIYTSYSPDCRKMEKNVFSDSRTQGFHHDNYVNSKVLLNSAEGNDFRERFKLSHRPSEYPAILYFTVDGTLNDVYYGGKSQQELLTLSKKAVSTHQTTAVSQTSIPSIYTKYLDYQLQYRNGTKHPDFLYDYAYELKKFNDPYQHVVDEYLTTTTNLTSIKNLEFVYDFADDVHSQAFDILVDNKQYFKGLYNNNKINNRIKKAIRTSVITAATTNDKDEFNHALKVIEKAKLQASKSFEVDMMALYYEKTDNWSDYVSVISRHINNNSQKDAASLNQAAWKFAAHIDDNKALENALDWAKTAADMKSEYEYTETYAALLYKVGKKSKALKEGEKAIEQARKQGHDYSTTLRLMEIMRTNQPLPSDLK
ncbi:MAG: thioredoxin family protein [Chitinophagales bacterium]